MTSLLERILPLALGAAASPMLFAATVLILASRPQPHARTLAFLAGVASPFVVLGLVVTILAGPTFSPARFRIVLPPAVEIGFGTLLLLLALVTGLVPGKAKQPAAATIDAVSGTGMHWFPYYGLGLTTMVLNPTAIVLFVLAAASIGQASVETVGKAVAYVLVIAVALAPIEVPLILDLAAPAYTRRLLEPVGQWVRAHSRLIGVVVLALLGAYLVVIGLKAF